MRIHRAWFTIVALVCASCAKEPNESLLLAAKNAGEGIEMALSQNTPEKISQLIASFEEEPLVAGAYLIYKDGQVKWFGQKLRGVAGGIRSDPNSLRALAHRNQKKPLIQNVPVTFGTDWFEVDTPIFVGEHYYGVFVALLHKE